MRIEFQVRRKIRWFLESWVFIIVVLAVCGVLFKATYNIYQKKLNSDNVRSAIEKELEVNKKKQDTLTLEKIRLESEGGIDEEIRKRFRLTKEGEKLIVIVNDKEKEIEKNIEEKSKLEKMWDNFLDFWN